MPSRARLPLRSYATFKARRTELFLTMPHHQDELLWQLPHCGKEGEVKNAPGGGGGEGMSGLGINRAITNLQQYAEIV